MKYSIFILTGLLISFLTGCTTSDKLQNSNSIRPYEKNLKYWQYNEEPVLLLGGSKTDHLFLADSLLEHLDVMERIGANYVRNTMSQREGLHLKPHKQLDNGKFDLNQWNDVYWKKFADFLKWTNEREIIVQIEVWDRFDYSTEYWQHSPWRPENNINYSGIESGFADTYPKHPSQDLHPFFHTIPGMPEYQFNLDLIHEYQKIFVDKMLSYSLNYGHVLYCMNNETSTHVEWGQYWINYIHEKANMKNVTVYCTDMFDNFFIPRSCPNCLLAIQETDIYEFLDVSQINSRNFKETHWDTLKWIIQQRDSYSLRPVNNTKIYGGGHQPWGTGSNEDGIERFCRNIIGGCASVRHHRPISGNGLNDKARASIQAVRKVEMYIKLWEVVPMMDLLYDREDNEAYISANDGEKYVIYFPGKGDISLNMNAYKYSYDIMWININTGEYGPESTLEGGDNVRITTPSEGSWFAIILKQ